MAYTSSVDDFVQRILADDRIANPNRYWVEFSFPPMGNAFSNSINQNVGMALRGRRSQDINNLFNNSGQLAMMCTTAMMPGRQINSNEHKHENYPIRIPYSVGYTPVTFGFTLSENLKERRFFELWQDVIVNVMDGTMNFYNEYVAPIKIYQLDKQNNVTYGVELRECYPSSISDISYTYAANNELLNMSVTMNYKFWKYIEDRELMKSLPIT